MLHLRLRRSLIDSPWQDRIDLASLGPRHLAAVEKALFSMATPEVLSLLEKHNFNSLVCVLQSTLDLLERGYTRGGRVELQRGGGPGAQTTKSESMVFQLQGVYFTPIVSMGDIKGECHLCNASKPNVKAFANVIKAEKETTTQTLQTLLPVRHSAL